MPKSDRDALIAAFVRASAPKPLRLEVDGIGTVYVRVMTAYDADAARKAIEKHKKEDGCEVGRVLATMLCDEAGELLFDIANAEHALTLSKLHPRAQTTILNEANGVNSGAGK